MSSVQEIPMQQRSQVMLLTVVTLICVCYFLIIKTNFGSSGVDRFFSLYKKYFIPCFLMAVATIYGWLPVLVGKIPEIGFFGIRSDDTGEEGATTSRLSKAVASLAKVHKFLYKKRIQDIVVVISAISMYAQIGFLILLDGGVTASHYDVMFTGCIFGPLFVANTLKMKIWTVIIGSIMYAFLFFIPPIIPTSENNKLVVFITQFIAISIMVITFFLKDISLWISKFVSMLQKEIANPQG